jgi:hypothetical protein
VLGLGPGLGDGGRGSTALCPMKFVCAEPLVLGGEQPRRKVLNNISTEEDLHTQRLPVSQVALILFSPH